MMSIMNKLQKEIDFFPPFYQLLDLTNIILWKWFIHFKHFLKDRPKQGHWMYILGWCSIKQLSTCTKCIIYSETIIYVTGVTEFSHGSLQVFWPLTESKNYFLHCLHVCFSLSTTEKKSCFTDLTFMNHVMGQEKRLQGKEKRSRTLF